MHTHFPLAEPFGRTHRHRHPTMYIPARRASQLPFESQPKAIRLRLEWVVAVTLRATQSLCGSVCDWVDVLLAANGGQTVTFVAIYIKSQLISSHNEAQRERCPKLYRLNTMATLRGVLCVLCTVGLNLFCLIYK